MSKVLKFKTVAMQGGFKGGETACRGCVIHEKILEMDEVIKGFAEFAHINVHDARYYATYFVDYLVHAVSEGYRLNLDAFSLYLTMKGRINGANGQFDRDRNSLELNIVSKKPMKDALAGLDPVNVTMDGEALRITGVMDEAAKTDGVVTPGATVFLAGNIFLINTSREDEGVWLEDSKGEIVLRADVLASTATTLDCIFRGAAASGEYRLVVSTRMGDASRSVPALARRKVTLRGQ